MPKVSVVVPVYNVEKYLRECLDSLVGQTMSDIEFIIVDDGSTDKSSKICDEYAARDTRIKVIHKKNEGVGKAYNTGIDASRSEYIGFLESDDFAEFDMFENLYNKAKEHDLDMIKSNWFFYWSKPRVINKKNIFFDELKINEVTNSKEQPLLFKIQPSVWTALYKREFLLKNNIRFLETPGASYQDTAFAFKTMALAECFMLLDECYVHYRQDNEMSSVKSGSKVFAICDEYNELDKFLAEHPDFPVSTQQYKWINQYRGYVWNLHRISEEHHDAFLAEFSNSFKRACEKQILGKEFFEKTNVKDFELLINDKDKFLKKQLKIKKDIISREKRRKIFSLRINSKQIRFCFLGKEYFCLERQK